MIMGVSCLIMSGMGVGKVVFVFRDWVMHWSLDILFS